MDQALDRKSTEFLENSGQVNLPDLSRSFSPWSTLWTGDTSSSSGELEDEPNVEIPKEISIRDNDFFLTSIDDIYPPLSLEIRVSSYNNFANSRYLFLFFHD